MQWHRQNGSAATELYHRYQDTFSDADRQNMRAANSRTLRSFLPALRYSSSTQESMAPNRINSGAIIIAGSGNGVQYASAGSQTSLGACATEFKDKLACVPVNPTQRAWKSVHQRCANENLPQVTVFSQDDIRFTCYTTGRNGLASSGCTGLCLYDRGPQRQRGIINIYRVKSVCRLIVARIV